MSAQTPALADRSRTLARVGELRRFIGRSISFVDAADDHVVKAATLAGLPGEASAGRALVQLYTADGTEHPELREIDVHTITWPAPGQVCACPPHAFRNSSVRHVASGACW